MWKSQLLISLVLFSFEFVKIQPGEFIMGCSTGDTDCSANEKPAHRVKVTKGFEIGKYEVTQALWESVMGANPSDARPGIGPGIAGALPVNAVSLRALQEFLQKLNARQDGYRYRLPTEAEWEYAARAGTTERYYGPSLDAIAWYSDNANRELHPVGQKQPNAWGLYDMLGNVSEMVEDWFDPSYYQNSPEADPAGPVQKRKFQAVPNGNFVEYRIVRGGSYRSLDRTTRVSNRHDAILSAPDSPTGGNAPSVGFRLVREAIR